MKKISIIGIIIFVSLILTAFLFLINDIVISIRLNELRSNLQEIDRREGSIDNISLVATYEIHKKLFENRITQDTADALENRINSLIVLKKENSPPLYSLYSIISSPALKVINFNRNVLGKKPLTYYQGDDSSYLNIDLAYYYERNFHFERAIELYEKSLSDKKLTKSLRAGILLHQGYCYALSGSNEKAREKYLIVLEKFSQESSAITATILLKYLEGFKNARENVLNSKDDPISRSQNLVYLLAYKQALSILEAAEKTAKPEDLPRIKYFKARCFTGLGDTKKAVEQYLQVIIATPSSKYAQYSNRKLYMIGSETGESKIQKLSIELNRKRNDPVLNEMIINREGTNADLPAKKDLIEVDLSAEMHAKVTKIVSKEKKPALKSNSYLIIFTSDGNTFKGTLIEETADYISIMTSIGRINVKRDRITRITEK